MRSPSIPPRIRVHPMFWGGRTNWRETNDDLSLHPEGMSAISRGLSEATPPETEAMTARTPVGVPAGCCDPYRGRFRRDRSSNRGYRFAQPPANCWEPSGFHGGNRPSFEEKKSFTALPVGDVQSAKGEYPSIVARRLSLVFGLFDSSKFSKIFRKWGS